MSHSIRCSRRRFVGGLLAASAWGGTHAALAAQGKLSFAPTGKEFTFDTGVLRGTFRAGGQSKGLIPAVDCATGTSLTRSLGLFSHYRLLDDRKRYGKAGWDWASAARLQPDGAVLSHWSADADHPFEMKALYRWAAPNTLDLTTWVTARKPLRRFEVFLASYFDGFPSTTVYAKGAAGGPPAMAGLGPNDPVWHMFPRDAQAVEMIEDGRWQRPPSPVKWHIRSPLAAPLAVRRDADRGLAAVLMAGAADCFAVAAPRDGEGHRSVYLSLFGRDFRDGESAVAHARLVIGRGISDADAVRLYEVFQKEKKPA